MSSLSTIINTLKKAKPILLKNYPIKTLALFGSVSRSEDNENSDIDIMVEFDHPVGMQFIHLCLELEKILNRKVDLVSRKGIKEKYFNEIKEDLIYV
ncbi:MAG: nucleotidyltransferase family protein [Ignavibacteriaceae bacterium]|nr:nucleotidyltransferase family protein [Ignavibacterium sp.]MCC6254584.1 nucleotidyltransferase family protein [Ignavibacteriaceae bacterium]HMN23387.1 nucleotidyltransferase family protein [Ignavibacteriaceae bacterium]HRN27481.1 nucleotidyltransferase family protein [Ignavibacteriaceae bacterium]HRP91404.1 nucleotidyltransferase family protein [Ignavibacteriaceae bacterium]